MFSASASLNLVLFFQWALRDSDLGSHIQGQPPKKTRAALKPGSSK